MATHTPRIPILLDKRRVSLKRIATLGAEEVADVPLGPTRHHDLALDGRVAALAARAEELVEVEVAVEARALVHRAGRRLQALGSRARWLGVEGDAFEPLAAVVAGEAGRVEAVARGGYDAAGDG